MKIEKRISRRFALFGVLVVILFAVLVGGLYNLQISNADQYQSSVENQRVKTIRLTGQRGMITDADSVVLAMSEPMYNLTFYRSNRQRSPQEFEEFSRAIKETLDIVKQYGGELAIKPIFEKDPELDEYVFNFGRGVSQRTLEIRERQWRDNHALPESRFPTAQSCFDYLMEHFQLNKLGYNEENSLEIITVHSEMIMNIYLSVPIVIAKDVSFTAVSEIIGRSMVLPGMDVQVGEKRVYPRNNMASHVIGYVGPIAEGDNYAEELRPLGYALNDTIGKDGIEKSMENWLTPNISSRSGYRVMERDNNGRLTREISSQDPVNGNNVKLTINSGYQMAAERAIAENVLETRSVQERRMFEDRWRENNREKLEQRDFDKYPLQLAETGAMMVIDVNSGRVLAMAQYPNFDLNAMVAGGKATQEILTDERNVLINHNIHTAKEPGSIFKMVPAMAALTHKAIDVTTMISDEGYFTKYTRNEAEAPTCWISRGNRSRHANLTVVQGISNSCNYFFYEITSRLYGDTGSNLLYKYAAQMGLTTRTGIQLPGEKRSIVGNQTSLYDPTVSLNEQETFQPMLVAASIKAHLQAVGSSYGIEYDDVRLDTCIKRLMDMALNTHSDDWSDAMRPILMAELNMTRDMVWKQATVGDIWIYLNDIKWGGGLEVQMGIGQSITVLTPAAVSRYVASLGNGGTVYNLTVVDSITSPEGEILNQYQPNVMGRLQDAYLYLPYIKEGMKGVVDDSTGGTAYRRFNGWKHRNNVWAKTGTSQVTIGRIKLDLENNSWFVLLAPYETETEIAVVVMIPNGLAGAESTLAAKNFIDWWMDNRQLTVEDRPVVGGNELMP